MRAAPPVQVVVSGNSRWVWAVRSLALLCIAVVLAWIATQAWAGGHPGAVHAAAAVGTFALVLQAWRSPVQHARALRWDGTQWSVGVPGEAVATDSAPIQPRVVMDLGAWMLLRCDSGASGFRIPSVSWLAVQCSDLLPSQWHGLRCALYGPLPPEPGHPPTPG